jgi:hypothetical protein
MSLSLWDSESISGHSPAIPYDVVAFLPYQRLGEVHPRCINGTHAAHLYRGGSSSPGVLICFMVIIQHVDVFNILKDGRVTRSMIVW